MAQVRANGLTLEVERHGDPGGVPLVLIRGLGSQLIQWPASMIDAFVAGGCHVVTFDNRDAGMSEKWGGEGDYTLSDMAGDTVGLMDALNLPQAHVLGMSMGGMILQLLALAHPGRVRSGVAVMSSSRAAHLPKAAPEVQAALVSAAPSGRREDVIAHELRTGRLWQSPGWPFDAGARAAMIGRCWDRCHCPDGAARQYRAMVAAEPDLTRIGEIAVPFLVIHGTDDTLLPVEHGRDIARRVPGARMVEIDGMGHDLEGEVPLILAEHALRFIGSVESGARTPKD